MRRISFAVLALAAAVAFRAQGQQPASLFNAGQTIEADEPLRQAIKIEPRYAPPYYLLGRVAEELGLPAEARDHYKNYLIRAPLSAGALRADAEQRLEKLPK